MFKFFIKKVWNKVADDKIKKTVLIAEITLFLLALILLIVSLITINPPGISAGIVIMIIMVIIIILTVLLSYFIPQWTHCCTKNNMIRV
jgi:TRAP-type uncharacterized transport system fused permease subunit